MRCAPSRTAKEALRAASAIADAIAFAIGQPAEVDVNEIIVRPGRKHALITRSRLPERTVDRKGPHLSGPFVELPGIETDALPGNLGSELPVRSVSFPFVTCGFVFES